MLEGRGEAGVELGGGQAARELAQLVDRHLDLDYRLVEGTGCLLDGGGAQLMLGVAQCEPDRDEALLGAVVEVTLESPPLQPSSTAATSDTTVSPSSKPGARVR